MRVVINVCWETCTTMNTSYYVTSCEEKNVETSSLQSTREVLLSRSPFWEGEVEGTSFFFRSESKPAPFYRLLHHAAKGTIECVDIDFRFSHPPFFCLRWYKISHRFHPIKCIARKHHDLKRTKDRKWQRVNFFLKKE